MTGLAGSTLHYWRVNASNAGGTSAWSAVWSFTTGTGGNAPAAPTLVSPADGSTTSRTPTLSWNASTGATSYHVQVSTSPSFSPLAYDNASVAGTWVTLPQLGRKVTYYWHVSASNSFGTSSYSATWSFWTRNR